MLPVDLRNKLYALFIACLKSSEKISDFNRLRASGSEQAYLQDRIPRYQAVLKAWSKKVPSSSREDALALSELLFNQGLFFDCHEFLETSWNASEGSWKTCFQGIIQIAAGFHKLELNAQSTAGAAELIEKGLNKLKQSESTLDPRTIAAIEKSLTPTLDAIHAGRFTLSAPPHLTFSQAPDSP